MVKGRPVCPSGQDLLAPVCGLGHDSPVPPCRVGRRGQGGDKATQGLEFPVRSLDCTLSENRKLWDSFEQQVTVILCL